MLGRFVRPTIVTPSCVDLLAGPGQLAVAARLGGEVDDHRAGAHRSTADCGISFGAGRPGMSAVVMTTSKSADPRLELLLLAALLLGGQLARVAALGLLADDAELEELRAEALDLLLDHGPDVEAGDDGAEPPRGRDRLQPGDARADARAPWPARPCPPRSSASAGTSAAGPRRAATAL